MTRTRFVRRQLGAVTFLVLSTLAPAALADEPLPPGHPPVGPAGHGVALPGDIRLHGRFDIAYERYGYTDAIGDGKDAFRNYHRFLFLDRHTKDDPFYFNAEVLSLAFYEMGAAVHGPEGDIWRLSVAAGKVLVPFGADPLFHHAYGGRVGADQRVLPTVWGEYGIKGGLELDLAPVGLRIDAYVVRGYALRAADGIINLQTNAAPLDDLNFAAGGRVSASLGAGVVSYSVYGGTLDFGRSLVMQAFDFSLWRLDVPVLEDFAITLGAMRADVWGGDNAAYYHFADYLQVRYYPTDCLYIQYRGGLDMRDNRSGVFADATRLDQFDTSTHSVTVGWNLGNLTLAVQYLWQLELVDEQPDDFLRVSATYEF